MARAAETIQAIRDATLKAIDQLAGLDNRASLASISSEVAWLLYKHTGTTRVSDRAVDRALQYHRKAGNIAWHSKQGWRRLVNDTPALRTRARFLRLRWTTLAAVFGPMHPAPLAVRGRLDAVSGLDAKGAGRSRRVGFEREAGRPGYDNRHIRRRKRS